jgi:cell wall-associated NlpC family hydrolase
MPINFGQLGYVDQLVWHVSNAINGGVSAADDLPFHPSVDVGYGDPRYAAKLARSGSLTDRTPFVAGDDIADQVAIRRGVNPHQSGGNWLKIARSQLGVPYVFGAASPGQAFDCSGYTQWVVKRATGTVLPHSAREQAQATGTNIGRGDLQPGNLVYFSYGRLGKGVVDHVGIYIGNGKMIVAPHSGANVEVENVNWSAFVGGGSVRGMGAVDGHEGSAGVPGKGKKGKGGTTGPVLDPLYAVQLYGDQIPTGMGVLNSVPESPFSWVGALEAPATPQSSKRFSGRHADIEAQIYQGFMDAGRPDLARMVGTKAFSTWINQESGWNVGATSPANNHGLANDGLFQIWRGHSFNADGQVASMSAYDQAKLVAKHFNLSAGDIRSYASQIRSGTYNGWG